MKCAIAYKTPSVVEEEGMVAIHAMLMWYNVLFLVYITLILSTSIYIA